MRPRCHVEITFDCLARIGPEVNKFLTRAHIPYENTAGGHQGFTFDKRRCGSSKAGARWVYGFRASGALAREPFDDGWGGGDRRAGCVCPAADRTAPGAGPQRDHAQHLAGSGFSFRPQPPGLLPRVYCYARPTKLPLAGRQLDFKPGLVARRSIAEVPGEELLRPSTARAAGTGHGHDASPSMPPQPHAPCWRFCTPPGNLVRIVTKPQRGATSICSRPWRRAWWWCTLTVTTPTPHAACAGCGGKAPVSTPG